jgi:hypothetical protein
MLNIDQKCNVPGCAKIVGVSHLMCPEHWRNVPLDLRRDFIDNVMLGKTNLQYIAAAEAAINSVSGVEKQ